MLGKRKYPLIISVIVAVSAVAYFLFPESSLSNDEIREKFNCNRITMSARLRPTDVYCANPEQYRKDLKYWSVIR